MASITSAAVKVMNQRQTAAFGLSRPVRERPWACQGNGTSRHVASHNPPNRAPEKGTIWISTIVGMQAGAAENPARLDGR
jgi:hypothetical protein